MVRGGVVPSTVPRGHFIYARSLRSYALCLGGRLDTRAHLLIRAMLAHPPTSTPAPHAHKIIDTIEL